MGLRFAIILILAAGPALGQSGLDEALGGFEDDPPATDTAGIDDALTGFDEQSSPESLESDQPGVPPPWLRIGGSASQEAVVNFAHRAPSPGSVDHRGLSSLRTRLNLEADADLGPDWRARLTGHAWLDFAYKANGRKDYPSEFLNEYEREASLGEFFLQGPLTESLDLKLGRQIVVWGRSDFLRVTDILNPIDNRLPGMTDIRDLRLPVAMARLDLYAAPWSASIIAIPERRFDKTPLPGSDFLPGTAALPPRDSPDDTLGAPEAALAITGTFPGWDASFYFANVYDSRPHLEATRAGPRRRHSRAWMVGAAGSAVFGSWLLKGEVAAFEGLRYSTVPEQRFRRLTALAGAEYSGFVNTALSLEASNSHILDFDARLAALPDDRRRNELTTALRISRRFRNDTIEATLVALAFGEAGNHGALQRLQVSYQWTDAVEMTTGLVLYSAGDQAPFRGIGENDRFFLRIDCHF